MGEKILIKNLCGYFDNKLLETFFFLFNILLADMG